MVVVARAHRLSRTQYQEHPYPEISRALLSTASTGLPLVTDRLVLVVPAFDREPKSYAEIFLDKDRRVEIKNLADWRSSYLRDV